MAEDNIGLLSVDKMDVSDQMNQEIDNEAKLLLKVIHFSLCFLFFSKESSQRVEDMLLEHEEQLRDLSKALYHYDYLSGKHK